MFMDIGIVTQEAKETRQVEWRIQDFFSFAKDTDEIPHDNSAFIEAKATSEDLKNKNFTALQSPIFPIANDSWRFRLLPKWCWCFEECLDKQCSHPKYVAIVIINDSVRDYNVEYECCLKKSDGSMDYRVGGNMQSKVMESGPYVLIEFSDLLWQKSDLVPDNVLTVMCTVKRNIPKSEIREKKLLKLRMLDKLSENFKDIYKHEESTDTILKLPDAEFKAHKFVLTSRSPVLAAALTCDSLEKQPSVITIPDYYYKEAVEKFLQYLYYGIPEFEELCFGTVMDLYSISNKYNVQELKECCIAHLTENMDEEDVTDVAILAKKHNDAQLFSAAQDYFNKNALEIFLTFGWHDLLTENHDLANTLLREMSLVKLKEQNDLEV